MASILGILWTMMKTGRNRNSCTVFSIFSDNVMSLFTYTASFLNMNPYVSHTNIEAIKRKTARFLNISGRYIYVPTNIKIMDRVGRPISNRKRSCEKTIFL
jgi:heme/copper-type cytochrome/quinol oxidase subunit 1